MKLNLTLASGLYDRIIPLAMGSVAPDGIDLNVLPINDVADLFRRQSHYAEFDVSEMSLCATANLYSKGDRRFMAIPIFPSRYFRHAPICVNANAGIREPKDLIGKRVGAMEYGQQTAAVWQRGMLKDDYGVNLDQMDWFFGGFDEPGNQLERISVNFPSTVRTNIISNDQCLDNMLEKGEIDATIGARAPGSMRRGSPNVKRLFPNYKDVETDYFRRTVIFPIMHTVVIKREIYDKDPWVAISLFDAFSQAKARVRGAQPGSGPYCMLPWMGQELEEVETLMGSDPFAYGLEANRHVLETFFGYCLEQGMIDKPVTPEELFAPETHHAVAH